MAPLSLTKDMDNHQSGPESAKAIPNPIERLSSAPGSSHSPRYTDNPNMIPMS